MSAPALVVGEVASLPDDDLLALERIRLWVDTSRSLEGKAQRTTMERAADLIALYERKRWVTEIPPPKNKVWRGRPVDPESFNRFAGWVLGQTGLSPGHARMWDRAQRLTTDLLVRAPIKPTTVSLVRPLIPLRKMGYGDRIPELWQRAVDLAGGLEPTATEVKHVVSEFRKELGTRAIRSAQHQAKVRELRDIALDDLRKLYEIDGSDVVQSVLDDFIAWANRQAGAA